MRGKFAVTDMRYNDLSIIEARLNGNIVFSSDSTDYSIEYTISPLNDTDTLLKPDESSNNRLRYIPLISYERNDEYPSPNYYGTNYKKIEITLNDDSITTNLNTLAKDVKKINVFYYRHASGIIMPTRTVEILNKINTSNFIWMDNMFDYCSLLKNINYIGEWDVSNVTEMHLMFRGCSSLTSLDLSGWDIQNVHDMRGMCQYCTSLKEFKMGQWFTKLQGDIKLNGFFTDCNSLKILNLSGLDTELISLMEDKTEIQSFLGGVPKGVQWCFHPNGSGYSKWTLLETEIDYNGIFPWNVSDRFTMEYEVKQGYTGIPNFTSGYYKEYLEMPESDPFLHYFKVEATTASGDIIDNLNGSDIVKIKVWFSSDVREIDFTNMSGILTKVNYINTENLTSMYRMFWRCSELTSVNASSWDVSNVTDMTMMFCDCNRLTSVGNLYYWDTGNVTNMHLMFQNCYDLTSVGDIYSWKISQVEDVVYMFQNCRSLTSISISSWDFSGIKDVNWGIASMFSDCTSLKTVSAHNCNVSTLKNFGGIFYGCTSLESISLLGWDVRHVDKSVPEGSYYRNSMLYGVPISCYIDVTNELWTFTEEECSWFENVNNELQYGTFTRV